MTSHASGPERASRARLLLVGDRSAWQAILPQLSVSPEYADNLFDAIARLGTSKAPVYAAVIVPDRSLVDVQAAAEAMKIVDPAVPVLRLADGSDLPKDAEGFDGALVAPIDATTLDELVGTPVTNDGFQPQPSISTTEMPSPDEPPTPAPRVDLAPEASTPKQPVRPRGPSRGVALLPDRSHRPVVACVGEHGQQCALQWDAEGKVFSFEAAAGDVFWLSGRPGPRGGLAAAPLSLRIRRALRRHLLWPPVPRHLSSRTADMGGQV